MRPTGEGQAVIAALAFYAFAAVLVASAAMVVTSRNPVHAVLFLILAFFNAAGLFLLAGAEFLALILVIVYVGAVAVLFLFVVMMLDVNFAEMRSGFVRYLPIGGAIGVVLLAELLIVGLAWTVSPEAPRLLAAPVPAGVTNTQALGRVIYTDYIYLFQAAGLVLLVAMIGAIVLTLRDREGTKRQDIARQIDRSRRDTLDMIHVPSGQGMTVPPKPEAPKAPEPAEHGHGHGQGGGHH
jgi:NADH-quinone oxidoreductase subunit J